MRRALVLIFLVAGALPLLGAPQRGEDAERTGALKGSVTDVRGVALGGVKVTVDGDSLEEPLEAETNSSGEFLIEGLEPGRYDLTAELLGYDTVSQDGIPVEAGQTYELEITMSSL